MYKKFEINKPSIIAIMFNPNIEVTIKIIIKFNITINAISDLFMLSHPNNLYQLKILL